MKKVRDSLINRQLSQKSNKVTVVSTSLVGCGQVNSCNEAKHACRVDSIVSTIFSPLDLQLPLVNQLM